MSLSSLFGLKRNDPTEGTVRASIEARQQVEKAADKLARVLDIVDNRADRTIRGFLDETRQRRDQT